jgi:hypothetical protein
VSTLLEMALNAAKISAPGRGYELPLQTTVRIVSESEVPKPAE